MSDPNPYQAPRPSSEPLLLPVERGESGKRVYAMWFGMFALNMVVPLLLGSLMATPADYIGIVAAAAVLLGLGFWVCRRYPERAWPVLTGAAIVGILQVVPVLQIAAGVAAVFMLSQFGTLFSNDRGPSTFVAHVGMGFMLTLVTGGLLLVASAAIGQIIRSLRGDRRQRSGPAASES